MPEYTTPRDLPYPSSDDLIAGSQQNLRTAFKDLAEKTAQQIEATAFVRGVLPNGTDLNDLSRSSDSGIWQLSSSSTYPNSPVNGHSATLSVDATDFSGTQTIRIYASSAEYRRSMNNSAIRPRGWGAWERYDIERQRVLNIEESLPKFWERKGSLAAGTNLDSLNGMSSNGIYTLSRSGAYPAMPAPSGAFEGAILVVHSTGVGDTIQTVQFRFDGGRFTRAQTGTNTFSEWRQVDQFNWTQYVRSMELLEGRAALAESGTPIAPMLETSGLWTTYGAGEALIDRVVRRNYPRRTISNPLEVKTLGVNFAGRRLRAVLHGDTSKPALLIMSGVHGDETSSREAALKLISDLSLGPVMQDRCVIIVPTVNPDGTNTKRVNDQGADLNRRWADEDDLPETQAVKSLFADYDIRAVLDCHEGGNFAETQFAINESAGNVALSQQMFDAAAAAVDTDPTAFPSGVWVDEIRVGSAMEVLPAQFEVPYLLVEMPGGLGDATYYPDTGQRMHSYRVVFEAIIDFFANELESFVTAS